MSQHIKFDLPAPLFGLLEVIWERGGLTLQSDWARSMAVEVALAASLGWLSTVSPDGRTYSNVWRLTPGGLAALSNKDLLCSPSLPSS